MSTIQSLRRKMAKCKQMDKEKRIRVSVLAEEGYSCRQIAKRVGCSHSAVVKLLQKKNETGSVADRSRSGRPRLSNDRQDRVLRRTSLADRRLTSPQLVRQWREKCGVMASPSTVRKRCLEFGLRGCKARRKPLLSDAQRKCRVEWAKKYLKWTCKQWEKVLFSDESTFCLFGDQAHAYVRRFPGEEYKPECINVSVKHPLKIMVWGCMAASGVGRLHIVEGMVNAAKYIDILQKCMIPSAEKLFRDRFIFQDDNAPCHRAKLVSAWKKQNKIVTLDWPAQSPDLNPIENLWHRIALEISKRRPGTKRELIESLIAAWNRVVTRIT
jgi:transposase